MVQKQEVIVVGEDVENNYQRHPRKIVPEKTNRNRISDRETYILTEKRVTRSFGNLRDVFVGRMGVVLVVATVFRRFCLFAFRHRS